MPTLLMNTQQLLTVLQDAPELELKGTVLLKERRSAGFAPAYDTPSNELYEAICEVVEYTERCAWYSRVLRGLTAVPLTSVSVLDYGL